jgi:hypothetical protein
MFLAGAGFFEWLISIARACKSLHYARASISLAAAVTLEYG